MSTLDDLANDLKALKRLARILDGLTPNGLSAAQDLLTAARDRGVAPAERERTA